MSELITLYFEFVIAFGDELGRLVGMFVMACLGVVAPLYAVIWAIARLIAWMTGEHN